MALVYTLYNVLYQLVCFPWLEKIHYDMSNIITTCPPKKQTITFHQLYIFLLLIKITKLHQEISVMSEVILDNIVND